MSSVDIETFGHQTRVLASIVRFKGAFAGKRGGKTEMGAIQGGIWQQTKPNFISNGRDPYLGIIGAPTHDMLDRLSWKKFLQYFGPAIKKTWEKPKRAEWHDGSEIIGLSADNPSRAEGIKANWAWIDEVFQVKEQFFLEIEARLSDSKGFGIFTGSLGVQYVNPKQHWAYRQFKKTKDPNYACFEWATMDNPHFPKEEIARLMRKLDKQTFEAMFTITWDIMAGNAVYPAWTAENEIKLKHDQSLPVYVTIDWGYAHPAAVLFIQYDKINDTVYVIDEIVESKLLIEELWMAIEQLAHKKGYALHPERFSADIAGNQEREQTGISNIAVFDSQTIDGKNVNVHCRRSTVLHGVSIVRSYVKSATSRRRLFVDPDNCPKLIDSIKNYRYPEREGIILNENPVKEADDPCDSLRYFFVNFLDEDWLGEAEVSSYA